VTEEQLAGAVVRWLTSQSWDVYQEVQIGHSDRRADIVAVSGRIVWCIEAKRSLTFAVVEQAAHHPAHLRSVAVPTCEVRNNGRAFARHVCRQNSVGVLTVNWFDEDRNDVVVSEYAPLIRCNDETAAHIRRNLRPEHKTAARAGTQGGYYTPFSRTMNLARDFIAAHPGCTIRDLMGAPEIRHGHYASDASCRAHLPGALRQFAPWCRVEDGRPVRFFLQDG
jgi:hypothetical protein